MSDLLLQYNALKSQSEEMRPARIPSMPYERRIFCKRDRMLALRPGLPVEGFALSLQYKRTSTRELCNFSLSENQSLFMTQRCGKTLVQTAVCSFLCLGSGMKK